MPTRSCSRHSVNASETSPTDNDKIIWRREMYQRCNWLKVEGLGEQDKSDELEKKKKELKEDIGNCICLAIVFFLFKIANKGKSRRTRNNSETC